MSHPRAISEQQAIELELWYREFERVGTFSAKAKEVGVTRITLRDTIRRVRGEDTRTIRRKLSALEIEQLVSNLSTFQVEPEQDGEEQLDTVARG